MTNPGYPEWSRDASNHITRVAITVRPNNARREYLADDPTFTFQVNGVLAADHDAMVAEIQAGSPAYATTAQRDSAIGDYDITMTGISHTENYTITYGKGTLTIYAATTRPGDKTPTIHEVYEVYDSTPYAMSVDKGDPADVVSYKVGNNAETPDAPEYTNAMDSAEVVQVIVRNPNYEDWHGTARNQITRRPVTATPNDVSRDYGVANPTNWTFKVEGHIAAEETTVKNLITAGGSRIYTLATQYSDAGTYDIYMTGSMYITNYVVTYAEGTLTIKAANKRPDELKPVIVEVNRQYNGTESSMLVYTYAAGDVVTVSVDNGSTWISLDDLPAYKDAMASPELVRVRVTNPNYPLFTETASNQITPRAITVRANNASRAYGEADPAFSSTLSGEVTSETADVWTALGTLTYTPDATITTPVGTYDLVVSGPTEIKNYTVTYVKGILTITTVGPRPSTPSLVPVMQVYDGSSYEMQVNGATVTGDVVEYSLDGGTTWSPIADLPAYKNAMDAGQRVVVRVTNPAYPTWTSECTNWITRRAIIARAEDKNCAFGEAIPGPTYILTNFVSGEEADIRNEIQVTHASSFSLYTNAVTGDPVGTYDIFFSGQTTLQNYTVTYYKGTLTISKANDRPNDQIPQVNPVNTTYDGNPHAMSVTNVDPVADTVEYYYGGSWQTTAPSYTGAMNPVYVQVRVSNDLYETWYGGGTNVINKAPVMVTADFQERFYGEDNPTLTSAVNGVITAEESVIIPYIQNPANGYTITTNAVPTSEAGRTYPITVSGPVELDNYIVSYTNGVLKVNKLTTRPSDKEPVLVGVDRVYDANTYAMRVENQQPGDVVTYYVGGVPQSNAPSYTDAMLTPENVRVVVTGTNYPDWEGNVDNQIKHRAITATPITASRVQGDPDPTFDFAVSGALASQATAAYNAIDIDSATLITSNANAASPVGVYVLTMTGPEYVLNYKVTYEKGTLNVVYRGERPTGSVPQIVQVNREYNGEWSEMAVRNATLSGDVVEYSLTGGTDPSEWTTVAPRYYDAMTDAETVYVRVTNPQYPTWNGTASNRITHKAMTASADNKTSFYGEDLRTLTYSVSGVLDKDLAPCVRRLRRRAAASR